MLPSSPSSVQMMSKYASVQRRGKRGKGSRGRTAAAAIPLEAVSCLLMSLRIHDERRTKLCCVGHQHGTFATAPGSGSGHVLFSALQASAGSELMCLYFREPLFSGRARLAALCAACSRSGLRCCSCPQASSRFNALNIARRRAIAAKLASAEHWAPVPRAPSAWAPLRHASCSVAQ